MKKKLNERGIQKAAVDYARKLGWLAYKWSSPASGGVPDYLFIKDGLIMFVEFKAPGKKPTPRQKLVFDKIRAAGCIVHVVDSIEGKAIFDLSNDNYGNDCKYEPITD